MQLINYFPGSKQTFERRPVNVVWKSNLEYSDLMFTKCFYIFKTFKAVIYLFIYQIFIFFLL